jgi:hypothetical protein
MQIGSKRFFRSERSFYIKRGNAINTCSNKESTKMDLECLEAEIGKPIDQIRRKWWWILKKPL